MISNSENENQVFSGLTKAAIAVVTLGDEAASVIFQFLSDEEVQALYLGGEDSLSHG